MDMARVDAFLVDRLGRAGVHRNVGAGHGQSRQHVLGGALQVHVAEHRGDAVRYAPVGDQQQQRLGVVDGAGGIEDQPVASHMHIVSPASRRSTGRKQPAGRRSSACGTDNWPLPHAMMSEIFPLRARGPGMIIASISNWGFNFVVVFAFPLMLAGPGLAFTFTLFAVICLGGILFTLLRVPETTGLSLEAIEKHLQSGRPLVALRREVFVGVAVATYKK